MSEPVSLPASCPLCGGPVWLELSPAEAHTSVQAWTCPYCAERNEARIDGKILWIVKRYGEASEPLRH